MEPKTAAMEGAMEVSRLDKEELTYELAIRGVTDKATVGEKRSCLRQFLKLEKHESNIAQLSYPYTFAAEIAVLGIFSPFLFLVGLKYDIILGADFLNKHGVVIDYDSREIRLDKNCVKFENVIKRRMENEGWQELIINGLYKGMNDSICDKEIFDVGDEFNENGDCEENISVGKNVMNVVEYEKDGMGNKEEANDGWELNYKYGWELNYKCKKEYKEFVYSLLKNNKRLVDETVCIAPDIFQHKLVVNESLPFNPKIYPIPEAFRAQVSREIQKMLDNKVIERTVTSFYPIPEAFRAQVSREIQKMLDNKVIERTVTSYINPIVVVKKHR
ncbi:hypothetical protein QE152_g4844 [Popillia japonica]|uniref:Uncharacterized protein n=1 Tax=Popillia japonica TaxID=7064 RepID=A0AAW1MSR8_POPJA